MKTIWKVEIKPWDRVSVELPEGADILTVQLQNGLPHIWALVDDQKEIKMVEIYVFGTGQLVPNHVTLEDYIGTYQMNDGKLVYHLFRTNKETKLIKS